MNETVSDPFKTLAIDGPDTAGVVSVRLDSGLAGNLMTAAMHADLAALWPALQRLEGARCVLLTGRPDGFCAGSEPTLVEAVATGDSADREQTLEDARRIVLGALDCELPVVAAVRGRAVGAALGIALLADICVVAEDAVLADGHARIGVASGDHAVLIWPLLCGIANAKRYLLLADAIPGERAKELGLVSECAPDAEVESLARGLADRLAATAPAATRWTKRALNHWLRAGVPAFESSLAHELLTYGSPSAVEGARSLAERRAPRF